jgi:hypothetical protein
MGMTKGKASTAKQEKKVKLCAERICCLALIWRVTVGLVGRRESELMTISLKQKH